MGHGQGHHRHHRRGGAPVLAGGGGRAHPGGHRRPPGLSVLRHRRPRPRLRPRHRNARGGRPGHLAGHGYPAPPGRAGLARHGRGRGLPALRPCRVDRPGGGQRRLGLPLAVRLNTARQAVKPECRSPGLRREHGARPSRVLHGGARPRI
ncbi:hypothetical protein MTBUT4_150073 [Magnetospirillum sp. UT-4]|nr:hypothetical protein MTBUT4_150073 [Magnetospirillum sp. UT-4]